MLENELGRFTDSDSAGSAPQSLDARRYAFSLSLLLDIKRAGGRIVVSDSQIYVSWPDWHSDGGREIARAALAQAREPKKFIENRNGIESAFLTDVSTDWFESYLEEAEFSLVRADGTHPSGTSYTEIFNAALGLWNMPYRGRTGRTRRFLIIAKHELSNDTSVVGLIELGDDAPFNTERDALLGLRPDDLLSWISLESNRASQLRDRFNALRTALLPVGNLPLKATYRALLEQEESLIALATGRSQAAEGFIDKKRIAYALRLAHGEKSMDAIAAGGDLMADDYSLREGVRAIKDLTVPRITMEVTICGAVPPFSTALAGKLVIAFLGHPEIIKSTVGTMGSITGDVFEQSEFSDLMPDHGLLGLTTKGLYPFHSALYNRASVIGPDGTQFPLRKIGETKGATTTLLSSQTARLAQELLDEDSVERVSSKYGTGGAKRHRRLESAALSLIHI